MNFVLEGPDNGGKTTLGKYLSSVLGMPLVAGEGPPKSQEEMDARVRRYLDMRGVIFDRHPCISDPIYSEAFGRPCSIRPPDSMEFFSLGHFVIYVKPTTYELGQHLMKGDHETQEHVDMVVVNHKKICKLYESKMLDIADYIFRRGDRQLSAILRAVAQFPCVDYSNTSLWPSELDCVAATGRSPRAFNRWRDAPRGIWGPERSAGNPIQITAGGGGFDGSASGTHPTGPVA